MTESRFSFESVRFYFLCYKFHLPQNAVYEVTSAITATTQVTRQILNQSLSQVKVHLKANYNMYIKEETNEDRKKREEEEAEIERLYREMQMQQNEPKKKNPLTQLIEAL